MNIECRSNVFWLFYIKMTERHAAQAPALRERIRTSTFVIRYSAVLRFAFIVVSRERQPLAKKRPV
jgi:hypothetical protein